MDSPFRHLPFQQHDTDDVSESFGDFPFKVTHLSSPDIAGRPVEANQRFAQNPSARWRGEASTSPIAVPPSARSGEDPVLLPSVDTCNRAWASLTAAIGQAGNATLRDEVHVSLCGAEDRIERFVQSAFRAIGALPGMHCATRPLADFVSVTLGASARLIVPQVGDPFTCDLHDDLSTRVSGPRARIRRVILPGVEYRGRPLVRAIIHS